MVTFKRVVGAQGDVNELRYISALHQTSASGTRENGTISSIDVQCLLASRYNIFIQHVRALQLVRDLGGGVSQDEVRQKKKKKLVNRILLRSRKSQQDEEQAEDETEVADVEEYLDLVQVLALLLVPTLARAGKEYWDGNTSRLASIDPAEASDQDNKEGWYKKWKARKEKRRLDSEKEKADSLRPKPPTLIKDVLQMLLKDIYSTDGQWPPVVDEDLVEGILLEFGEGERAQDKKLIREMVQVASSPSGRLDEQAFLNALTNDLEDWKVGSEDEVSTLFADVFGGGFGPAEQSDGEEISAEELEEDVEGRTTSVSIGEKTKKMASNLDLGGALDSNIDYVVDSHSSVILVMLIWCFYIMISFSYAVLFQSVVKKPCEDRENPDTFGCQLGGTLWVWYVSILFYDLTSILGVRRLQGQSLIIVLSEIIADRFILAVFLSLFGLITIVPLSIGNNPNKREPRRFLLSLIVTAAYTV